MRFKARLKSAWTSGHKHEPPEAGLMLVIIYVLKLLKSGAERYVLFHFCNKKYTRSADTKMTVLRCSTDMFNKSSVTSENYIRDGTHYVFTVAIAWLRHL